ncbi:amino acid ABC transporter permease [Clostridium estertheticum]|uniref:amino acid ABC transporter permease n=1 Tax=Clostridium estertheticum TaxID=238834 RepID=UPI001C6E4C4F|nr:amino acid ABC transporter permease [Clostridium estertheticum]MBW9153752.1 amino acid ABC transporter permease [Clostridium estertheticum]WLC85885.1 amino acid ABC transporter permease [Clostridium estertheticum]
MDISILKEMFPVLLQGSLLTIELTIISVVIGTLIGIVTALMKLSKNKLLACVAGFYTWIFRGTPMLLQLFAFYYVLPFVGVQLSPFQTAIIGLSLNSGAYMAEIIRGGILSVDKGQFEACRSLGFTYIDTMKRVVLPQTFKIIIPSVGNEFITMLKDTSLVSTITMSEVMRKAQILSSSTFRPMEAFFIAGCLYLLMTTIFTTVFSYYEKKLSVY